MSWHQDGQMHITWGPEGKKLSPEEKEQHAAALMAEAKARREQHAKADKALEGLPFVAVPVDQLASLYERMLRLVTLGQSKIEDFDTLPETTLALRRAVFSEADFGAVYAGQWLPPQVRKATREKVHPAISGHG